MKRFGFFAAALALVCAFTLVSTPVSAEKPGAYYYGDSGTGDGVISPGDVNICQTEILSGTGDYSGVRPPVSHVQDIDGDAVISPSDLNIVQSWVLEIWGAGSSFRPDSITVVTTAVNLTNGDSTPITAYVSTNTGVRRPGWGRDL